MHPRRLLPALAALLLGAAAPRPAAAQAAPAKPGITGPRFIQDSLDAYVRRGLRLWNIPGLAVVVVKDGQTVIEKGYGTRAVPTPGAPAEAVDANTLFMIASNSKLFTGTVLAQLEEEKKLSLSDPVRKYLPDFRLYDSTSTRLVTVRDLMAHHFGTKTFQGDFTFWNSSLSRADIVRRMRLLKPGGQFRQDYGYCNSGFVAAGEIVPVVSGGLKWEDFVQQRIIAPLAMSNTYPLTAGYAQRANIALPYSTSFGPLTRLPFDNIDNLGPAASLVSSVHDLSHWLQFQLDSGRYEGRQIMPWATLRRTRAGNTLISARKSPILPSHFSTYGLGVFSSDYNGRQLFNHTGGADGFVTGVCFVPEERLGLAVLTNQDNQSFFEALRYQLLDAYLGVPYVDRSRQLWLRSQPGQAEVNQAVATLNARAAKRKKLPRALSAYAGTYQNPLYGPITVEAKGKQLVARFANHPQLTATFDYLDGEQFRTTYSSPIYGPQPATFTVENGQVKAVEIRVNEFIELDPYLFVKQ
ncbi:serine hydrolase [uncultured Hymenobacter sp.]|uniref:serine hydrolase n=1 Tax=uncultured Hymenobacter sp. TaxID=170016 RepID=UPI0035CBFED2